MYIHVLGTYYLYFTSVHKYCYRMSTCLFMSENKPVISHLSSCQTDTPRGDWKSNITCSIDVGVTLHWNMFFFIFFYCGSGVLPGTIQLPSMSWGGVVLHECAGGFPLSKPADTCPQWGSKQCPPHLQTNVLPLAALIFLNYG